MADGLGEGQQHQKDVETGTEQRTKTDEKEQDLLHRSVNMRYFTVIDKPMVSQRNPAHARSRRAPVIFRKHTSLQDWMKVIRALGGWVLVNRFMASFNSLSD